MRPCVLPIVFVAFQLPSVVPCNDSISTNFPLCQTKSRPQRDSNPQSSDSKSGALSVGPCGHVYCQLYLLLVQLPSVVACNDSISKNFPLCQTKSRPQRDSNPQSSDSKSDALSVGPCGHVYCQLYLLLFSCQVLSLVMTRFLRTFLCVKQKVDHRGIRTPNLLIRSQAPDPLGHAAMCTANCICCLFSCQVLFLVMTRFLRIFLCVKQKVDHRGIRTPNLLIRSQTPYPLGHAAMGTVSCICCLFSCQVSLVMTRFLRTFLCVKQKVDHRGIRTPNLLIRSQTPYPLGHAAMCAANCVCYLFSCQVLFLVMTRFLRTFLCVKQKVDHRGIRTPNLLIASQTLYPLGHAAIWTVNIVFVAYSVAKCSPL